MRRASNVMRHSIMGKAMNKIEIEKAMEKIQVVEEEAVVEQRFSVPEIDVDQYDAVIIEAEEHDEDNVNPEIVVNDDIDGKIPNNGDGSGDLEELMGIHEQLKRESLEIMMISTGRYPTMA